MMKYRHFVKSLLKLTFALAVVLFMSLMAPSISCLLTTAMSSISRLASSSGMRTCRRMDRLFKDMKDPNPKEE